MNKLVRSGYRALEHSKEKKKPSFQAVSVSVFGKTMAFRPMGSHHCQVAILVQDDKLDCFGLAWKKLGLDKTVLLLIRDQYCNLGLMAPH